EPVMKNLSKLLVCTALLALVWGQLPQLQARASSCHSHQHSPASNSSPRGHQCCQAGHNSAVPQNGMEFASPVQLARIEPLVMITSQPFTVPSPSVLPTNLPGHSPLRI